ncbi:MAG: Fur family transcriptional regulator [Anaerolineaceae bacterium]|nr:Fur family transcriptional regulator [Anaerolineaceae bacterium]OQY87323.1 MAG: hypothetical protein B6D38_13015 [Anaerolineae bacterium UTCFX1]
MTCASDYAPRLRELCYRVTPQRMAILHALRRSSGRLAPRDVYRVAKEDFPRLTEPTVYRTLDWLVKNGLARSSSASNGRLRYELAGADHHHVVCRVCGREIEVNHRTSESLYNVIEAESGYAQIDSHMTFFGICPACQQL